MIIYSFLYEMKLLELNVSSRFIDIPGIVGVIDYTYFPIPAPRGDQAELFRNRKEYFSLNVQVVCVV